MIKIPDSFRSWIAGSHSEIEITWLNKLPDTVADLCTKWKLRLDGPVLHGGGGIAVPVTADGIPLMLKVSIQHDETRFEADGLRHWNGHGMVRLRAHDHGRGALLLERLGPETLSVLPWTASVPIAGDLIRLHSIEGAPGFPAMNDIAHGMTRDIESRWVEFNRPIARKYIDMSLDVISHLTMDSRTTMVNKDLHFDNILRGTRAPWIAIDPKPLVGDPEFGVAQLFWRVIDRLDSPQDLARAFDTLVEHGELDPDRLRMWTLARVVDYWLWGLTHGLTEDPVRCETVIAWFGY